MTDFTLRQYQLYLELLKESGRTFYTFKDFIVQDKPSDPYCLIRHDVDRRPNHALMMARLEYSMNIHSTYYFRTKPSSFNKKIISEISSLNHEIGYHYESLSDANGDVEKAIEDFSRNLEILRNFAPIYTCSMHGRPLSKWDNRDMWKGEVKSYLESKFNLLGEVYLDIDYSNILYISDTGRNWSSQKNNLRDTVKGSINRSFDDTHKLIDFLKSDFNTNIVFQIHPERWSYNISTHAYSLMFDTSVNAMKQLLRIVR